MSGEAQVHGRGRIARVAALIRLLAGIVILLVTSLVDSAAHPIPWLASLAVYFVAWAVAYRFGRPVLEVDVTALDEREIEIRDSASWKGLIVLTSLIAALALALVLGDHVNEDLTETVRDRVGYILIGVILVGLAVTSLVALHDLNVEMDEDDLSEDDLEGAAS